MLRIHTVGSWPGGPIAAQESVSMWQVTAICITCLRFYLSLSSSIFLFIVIIVVTIFYSLIYSYLKPQVCCFWVGVFFCLLVCFVGFFPPGSTPQSSRSGKTERVAGWCLLTSSSQTTILVNLLLHIQNHPSQINRDTVISFST